MVITKKKTIEFSVYLIFLTAVNFRLGITDSLSRHCSLVIGARWASKSSSILTNFSYNFKTNKQDITIVTNVLW